MLDDTFRAMAEKTIRDKNKSMTLNNSVRAHALPEKKNLQGNHYNMPSQANLKQNLSISNTIGQNTTTAFFSAKNRKIYDIYNTKSIQKKKEMSSNSNTIPRKKSNKEGSNINVDRLINMSQSQLESHSIERYENHHSKLEEYMKTLKEINQQKDQLNDVNLYHMSPCRYIGGNRELGDMRVPWKLVKHKAILDE